jgi:hypothetical protein
MARLFCIALYVNVFLTAFSLHTCLTLETCQEVRPKCEVSHWPSLYTHRMHDRVGTNTGIWCKSLFRLDGSIHWYITKCPFSSQVTRLFLTMEWNTISFISKLQAITVNRKLIPNMFLNFKRSCDELFWRRTTSFPHWVGGNIGSTDATKTCHILNAYIFETNNREVIHNT